jgi:site-specific DNA recombinase
MQKRKMKRRKQDMMDKGGVVGAVLYIRVSTDEQANKALNLENQERTCREFCHRQGWPVVERFIDSDSARTAVDRPAFQRLLTYCRANHMEVRYVVVYDISRFARNVQNQAEAIAALNHNGVLLRSVSELNIDETAAGRMAANILGTFNQFFSDSLSEKMQRRTRQSAEAGRFPWRAPLGYRNIGGKEGANIVPDERAAPLVRRAFELMGTGRYKKTEVLKIITGEGLTTARGKVLSTQTFHALLRNPLYVGWVTLPSDDRFEPVRGLHQPLFSQELFDEVQAVLAGRSPGAVPKRKLNPAFPLKHFVKCDSCGVPLTGGFCTGRSKRYAYYWCRNPACHAVRLTGEQLEVDFLALLQRFRPAPDDVEDFLKMAAKVWAAAQGDAAKEARRLEARLEEQKRRKRKLLDSMLDGKISDTTYKQADEEFCAEIATTEKELRALESRQVTQDAFLCFIKIHLMDVGGAWQLGTPGQKHRVQNLLFDGGLFYSEKSGILNRSNSSLFSILELISGSKLGLASPTGFEPVLSP